MKNRYFNSALLGYTLGLIVTIIVMNWFQAAQVSWLLFFFLLASIAITFLPCVLCVLSGDAASLVGCLKRLHSLFPVNGNRLDLLKKEILLLLLLS